jgi:hypothetical protein
LIGLLNIPKLKHYDKPGIRINIYNYIMKYSLIVLAIIGVCFFKPNHSEAQAEKLVESYVRAGLPNFFGKIRSGQEVRIAYIGGSITAARNGWRDLTFNWFRTNYPKTSFSQIDATIGGTGSDLGVFRMDNDVLIHKPDLVFVEFAVNDSGKKEEDIRKAMEGIVRKTWKQFPESDICFVYTIAENVVETMRKGTYQNSAIAMEQIADHYQVPSVHMGVEVIRLLEAGKLIFTGIPEEHPGKVVFTKDRTHPLAASGHPIYAQSVIGFMKKMEGNAGSKRHKLPSPMEKDNWESAQIVPLSRLKMNAGWEMLSPDNELSQKFAKFMPVLYKASPPSAFFSVKFKGKILGVYDVIGPKTGIVEVTVDGQNPTEVYRFDAWCENYRKNTFFIKDLSDGVHEVSFLVTGKTFDKSEILKKRNIAITNPEDYNGFGWIANALLLVGELIN